MTLPSRIQELVERFRENREAYRSGSYNETQIRREFIDPFFEELGWDINNTQGYAEAYKDVIHEDAIKIGGNTKAPDYAFRIGGTRKFFLEAKKPSVNIKMDISPAYQLRRYAWSAKLPLSVLTDFEELAIYDCRIKPEKTDKASTARTKYYTFEEYEEKWDEIASIFSRTAVLKGSFDKYADDNRRKRGTAEVDDAFLAEIEAWRETLAGNIALRNPGLSVRELNTAVQRTIDRIIFLRIAEDRGIETYGRLQTLGVGKDVYKRLAAFFRQADDRYNSGLFHFKKSDASEETLDKFTLELAIDDKTIRDMLKALYYPDSPYEFSVLPADILGQVYEQFLGKVIRLSGKRAIVEEKPEVRKAGGVYYTPTYIVSYIVTNTLGEFLRGKSPAQVAGLDRRIKSARPLRVLDPACGSGSFLIEAYQYLLDWYRDQYVADGGERHAKGKDPKLHLSAGGEWRLTIAERRRILLTHIFGVDIDPQAVEVTKLSLLLKVLEGESNDAIARQMDMFHTRALPDLATNIKCGNSLVGSDFYQQFQMSLFSDEERIRLNTFDWEEEFPSVISSGGFDCVIGNPPYLYSAGQEYIEYFKRHYQFSQYQTDFYVYFIEKALKLTCHDGFTSYIIPDSWMNSDHFSVMRSRLVAELKIEQISVFDFHVFKKAAIENSIFVVRRSEPERSIPIIRFYDPLNKAKSNEIKTDDIIRLGIIDPRFIPEQEDIIAKIETCEPLSAIAVVNRGLHAYRTDGYGTTKYGKGPQTTRDKEERSYHASSKINSTYLPEIRGKDVFRFRNVTSGEFIAYGTWLAEPREPKFMNNKKLVIRKVLGDLLSGAYVEGPAAVDQSLYIILSKKDDEEELLYILGVLLSSVGSWYLRRKYSIYDRLYPWYTKKQLANFPLPPKNLALVTVVRDLIDRTKRLQTAKTELELRQWKKEIIILERKLGEIVARLYKLTPDEWKRITAKEEQPAIGAEGPDTLAS